jgi:First Longin domain of INTU, CCZ1 and HPS4
MSHHPHAIPAQLSFLAIYNPSLGKTDESLQDQIVFYSSTTTRARQNRKNQSDGSQHVEKEEENEQLRQVGLAQGMVDFAKWVGQIVSLPSNLGRAADTFPGTSQMESLSIPLKRKSHALYFMR